MKRIVLVGGGHSHLHCVKNLKTTKQLDIEWVLVSSSRYQYYSGMFSGFVEGLYEESDIRIDLLQLSKWVGIQFKEETISSVDPINNTLYSASGQTISYDYVSFDIGSLNINPNIPNLANNSIAVKPNHLFPKHINDLRDSKHPVIVGGGASGIEIALSLLAWKKKYTPNDSEVTLVHSSPLLHSAGERSSKIITELAYKSGLNVVSDESITTVTKENLITQKGNRISYSHLIYLGGPQASPLFRNSSLPTDSSGYMLVKSTLQNIRYPHIFGAGDCISIESDPNIPKNGVTAVRQGPLLWRNLNRILQKKDLLEYQPQRNYLALISIGNHHAMLTYSTFAISGKWTWYVKNWIDRRFMNKFQS
ncbi:NAD(P)/FAD-dependent oxidoreductase [Cytobacillus sp. IB215665]|uniref:NAD(P)/FAD-dependent oxidoreductase n=1 Tax=Cytobacillus sp. IB215665 TaxID=3097357 RepID=UPI002A0CC2E1|nr:FAD-dependent oxidoreductase [Cytobacillus sp. IB215665]MDX8365283.1 FAD-dependent oxidoreductase [Cytobacillus sp. IB215665]